jgi:ABC-type multidrug transport system ATPase subunit
MTRRKNIPPEAERKGATMSFDHICYNLKSKAILKDVCGDVKPGEVFAIMGPSGAGKSSFIDILAQKNKGGEILGSIKFGDEQLGKAAFRRISGYVDQEDTHLATMTVKEVVTFSAMLRLPSGMPLEQKHARVDEILKKLGLDHIANSRVGDSVTRGISGGEKRRLSIGVELVLFAN